MQRRGRDRDESVLSLFMSLVLIAVIVLSLALGVVLGYAIIFGILDVFDRSRRSATMPTPGVLSQSTSSD